MKIKKAASRAHPPRDKRTRRALIEHVHPAVIEHEAKRAADVQLRVADAITRFAGSMQFVYIHAIGFALWMIFVEASPWPTLTLVVSLEAIFLSTFVMIGQNRQGDFARRKADHDYKAQTVELHHNTELTQLIHALTVEIHAAVVASHARSGSGPSDAESPGHAGQVNPAAS
ncbi:DUF1003 domain-containing protein [Planotetraspora sp. GP83]|uniref:DUF1003 domain-containing protein n=1 Tax=Planotetraspora sp. GP83 TaxID=3156264 RepID=UPI003515AD7B